VAHAGGERRVPQLARAMTEHGFDVFLSYNSADRAQVQRIAKKLKRAGLEPWLDKWALIPGGDWQKELARGLADSRACAVFLGTHHLGDWEHQELGVALNRAAKDSKFRVFPVLLPGVPEPFDANSLPPFLATRTWVDFRRPANPQALQYLINAIKGVPFGGEIAIGGAEDVCPYRGLLTFDEEHAEFFFGGEPPLGGARAFWERQVLSCAGGPGSRTEKRGAARE
jgi:hypothetical protein